MFKLWGKIFKNGHIINDTVIECSTCNTRTHHILNSLDEICHKFNLSKPIWLNNNISEFKKRNKTRFDENNFIDEISFDFLEIEVLEE